MPVPLISVVIGTYNQKSILEIVLPEYEKQTLARTEFEVIVVDSSSTDGSAEWLTGYTPKLSFKPIIQPNRGKAAARNRGVQEARGRWIIITDADMIPDPYFIQTHLEAQQKKAACYEGLTYNMHRLEWPTDAQNLLPLIPSNPATGTRLGWFYFLTGNLSFSKALFEKNNGFDETFVGYGWEDLELGYRLSLQKEPLIYLPESVNYHYHVVPSQDDIRRCFDKGRSARHFLNKHPELKWFLGLNPLSVWVFRHTKEQGKLIQKMGVWSRSGAGFKSKVGTWFLKEYYYLSGILSKD